MFAPDVVSTAALVSRLARELQALGHSVSVITTTPHYNVTPAADRGPALRRRWLGLAYESDYSGIPVFHVRVRRRGNRVLGRILDFLWLHLLTLVRGLADRRGIDVVYAPSPPLTVGVVAWLIARLRGAAVIYNVQEIYPDIAERLGAVQRGRALGALHRVESFIYRHSDRVVVIAPAFARRIAGRGVPAGRLDVIANFVDTVQLAPVTRRPNPFSAEHGLDDRFVVLYAGNIGLTQDFETVLAAADLLVDVPDVVLVIVGGGVRRTWLEGTLAARPRANVLLLPYQPETELASMYGAADAGLVPLGSGMGWDTFPSKVYSIMAAARPVVALADAGTALADTVHEAGCGVVVAPGDAAALASAILALRGDAARREACGASGRNWVVRHHTPGTAAARYDSVIRDLAGD
ncbi:MAG TPA: glycosyltransferase family 4 protein [Longimicrobiales bacterium]|nr:glycosyltransferase family 4 protein [Longimicrobiales bacterium]